METRAPIINRTVLMTDTDNFSVVELNSYSDEDIQPDREKAKLEHESIKKALRDAGVTVVERPSPKNCQDGIYVANWAFCGVDKWGQEVAVMGRLPNVRQGEERPARKILSEMGKRLIIPKWQHYSGQGDTLVAGDTMFFGSGYRSDKEMKYVLERTFGDRYNVVDVQTIPRLDEHGKPARNKLSNWRDSYFYDIDLALGVVRPDMIAWCPEAFQPESAEKIRALEGIKKIEVDLDEALGAFACNFISTGETVIMGTGAPKLRLALAKYGISSVALKIPEIQKGGGSVRCSTLTLDNK